MMEKEVTKICSKCGLSKELCEFSKKSESKDGYSTHCKVCHNHANKSFLKNNPDYNKKYYILNREKFKQEYNKEYRKNYYNTNKEKIRISNNTSYNKRTLSDPLFKIYKNVSRSIRTYYKNKGIKKNIRTEEILGCDIKFYVSYIETQWSLPHNLNKNGNIWMNWSNHGLYNGTENYGWDIDHIKPLSSAKTEKELMELFRYTNQQPLCGYINRYIKKDRLDW